MNSIDWAVDGLKNVTNLADDETDPMIEGEPRRGGAGEFDVAMIRVDAGHLHLGVGVGQPERRVPDPAAEVEDRVASRRSDEHRRQLHDGRPSGEQPAPVCALVSA